MAQARREGYGVVLTDHVFDKVRSIDMALAELEVLLGRGEVIEETPVKMASRSCSSSSSGLDPSTWSLWWMTSGRRSVSLRCTSPARTAGAPTSRW